MELPCSKPVILGEAVQLTQVSRPQNAGELPARTWDYPPENRESSLPLPDIVGIHVAFLTRSFGLQPCLGLFIAIQIGVPKSCGDLLDGGMVFGIPVFGVPAPAAAEGEVMSTFKVTVAVCEVPVRLELPPKERLSCELYQIPGYNSAGLFGEQIRRIPNTARHVLVRQTIWFVERTNNIYERSHALVGGKHDEGP
jgi:hypothetical protein